MSKQRETYEARHVALTRCDHCNGLHLVVGLDDRSKVVAVLDAGQWAEMFMADDDFAKAAAQRLGRH